MSFDQLSYHFGDSVLFGLLDVDESEMIRTKYNIDSIPTLYYIHDEEVREYTEQYLNINIIYNK